MSLSTEPALYTKLGFDPAYQATFEDKLFIEGPQTARRLVTFFTLLLLLSLIVASFTISFISNGEINSRINPGLYALLTALGAGAAGAFIISRAEIADALGGVAIAISLVPPLCVVGISLRCGQMSAAIGSFLLFTTNFLAILFAGGVVLMIVGLGKSAASIEQIRLRRRGIILFVVCLVLIAIPLSLTAYQNITGIVDNNTATVAVQNWLQGTSYQVDSVSVNGRAVSVTVDGSGQLKPLQQLANQLTTALHRPIFVYVRTVPALNSESQSP